MKTPVPSLFSSLLMSATKSVRALLAPRRTALHGARANVLTVREISGEQARAGDEQCFLLDALIEPVSDEQAWSPGELAVCARETAEDESQCRVLEARVIENRRFIPAAGLTCRGARRVRLRVAVLRAASQVCFRHRDALFGEVRLGQESTPSVRATA